MVQAMPKPNVEILAISWVESLVTDAWPVFGDSPTPKPDFYILVDRTGGARESMVLDQAEILFEVYHKTSRVQASNMANFIADEIRSLTENESITRAKVNSVVKLDDTVNQYWRYQVYADVWCRR